MRKRAPKNARRAFTRSAMKVKKINLGRNSSRGGICL